MDEEQLLDRIYEAGAIPEYWPEVLQALAELAGVAGGLLFTVREGQARWMASPSIQDMSAGYFERGYPGRDDRTARLLAHNHPGFVVDLDVFSPQDWEADPIRREFFVPRGYGWGIATNIHVPTGDLLIFHGEGRLKDGPIGPDAVARLDRLRPHLARAALLSTRVAFERVAAAVAALDIVGIPAAVIDRGGQAIATNSRLDALNPDVVLALPGRLGLVNGAADGMLRTAVERLHQRSAIGLPHSIPIPASASRPPMIVHLHPVTGAARDIFTGGAAVLLVTPVSGTDVPSTSVIQGLFDLTPAEARVARALASGMTIGELADSHGTSPTTVRNQLRAVFAKTGISRQSELVGLLRGIAPRV